VVAAHDLRRWTHLIALPGQTIRTARTRRRGCARSRHPPDRPHPVEAVDGMVDRFDEHSGNP
jgi:hypothetical protein